MLNLTQPATSRKKFVDKWNELVFNTNNAWIIGSLGPSESTASQSVQLVVLPRLARLINVSIRQTHEHIDHATSVAIGRI